MVQNDATFGAPGCEPTPTPEAAPPIAADFMSSIMARLAHQDEVQKTTNDQLAALVAALTAPDGQTNHNEEETPKDNGEGDSSADEEHPANRRRTEVILSQQSLSSDDDNDDASVLGDLRDVLKRKFESENDSSPKHRDLRTMLDTRKSRRISTSDANNNKGPISDLRDKLNAGACDLRIQLNRSKPTDLRRQLERAKDGPSRANCHQHTFDSDQTSYSGMVARTICEDSVRNHRSKLPWMKRRSTNRQEQVAIDIIMNVPPWTNRHNQIIMDMSSR
ncbi:hypothetical protein F2Q69_00051124 [Brassica cretica]|uniref:Uncharacterized protein n=1 Tax=Brassica cretica TaxID=69181 RepID=A0A8S9PR26_BRACR|nr:hypothetical protein F2Q69_00051124 [Brassica cretica]